MESKVFTQYGYPIIVVSLAAIVGMVIAFVLNNGIPKEGLIPIAVVTVSLIIAILMTYKMTICVDDRYVWFRMGIGLVGKTYELSDISECRTVRIYSSGIRKIRNGNLYSIHGFKGIELKFHSTNRVVRLGTNRPDELCGAINNAISKSKRKTGVYY